MVQLVPKTEGVHCSRIPSEHTQKSVRAYVYGYWGQAVASSTSRLIALLVQARVSSLRFSEAPSGLVGDGGRAGL